VNRITISGAQRDTLDYIARHLRDLDYLELAATSPAGDPVTFLADRVLHNAAMAFTASVDGVPVSAWGLVPMWPGVGNAFAFGTDDWGKALLAMTRHVRRFMMPFLLENGYHRIECRSLASRPDVKRWLTIFDAQEEAVLRGSGARGEDFILYRWLKHEPRAAEAISLSRH
jgi:hypothetical protein